MFSVTKNVLLSEQVDRLTDSQLFPLVKLVDKFRQHVVYK